MKKHKKLFGAVCAVLLALGGTANAITIGDGNDLGNINPNHPANPTNSTNYVNILLAQPLGSGPTTIGPNTYIRTSNDPLGGSYPAAVFAAELSFTPDPGGGDSATVDLGTGGFLYLLGKYDGKNFGSEVWFIGGLTGTITMPEFGDGSQYGLS